MPTHVAQSVSGATPACDPLEPGEWQHRYVAAHGARFHITEAGHGPLVVLVHGHQTYWGVWRHQITALAAAGYRVVALDLRGYGASDKPPLGYDLSTMVGDVAGVVRALGASTVALVGIDAGAYLAHGVAAHHAELVSCVIAVAATHHQRPRKRWGMAHLPPPHIYDHRYTTVTVRPPVALPSLSGDRYAGARELPFVHRSHKRLRQWCTPSGLTKEAMDALTAHEVSETTACIRLEVHDAATGAPQRLKLPWKSWRRSVPAHEVVPDLANHTVSAALTSLLHHSYPVPALPEGKHSPLTAS